MPHRRISTPIALSMKTAQIAVAAPQVIAHRLARMAAAGPVLSKRDHREFNLMGAEKLSAFGESWVAMWMHAFQTNMTLMTSLARAFWWPWMPGKTSSQLARQLHGASLSMIGKGITPVHRTVTANAKRLAKVRIRQQREASAK